MNMYYLQNMFSRYLQSAKEEADREAGRLADAPTNEQH